MESSASSVALAQSYDYIYAAVGVHPDEVESMDAACIDRLRQMAQDPRVLAIGEIGLDYFRKEGHTCKDTQKYWFRQQLDLAVELEKPFIIHSRDAAEDTMEILQEFGKAHPDIKHPGVIHCYS